MRHISQLKESCGYVAQSGKKRYGPRSAGGFIVSESDRSLEEEIPVEIEKVERSLEELEFELQLGGEYDRRGLC